jgi:hypothetical protein
LDAVTRALDKYCRGCYHWRNICPSNQKRGREPNPCCHYLLDTGHARIKDCPPGKGCIHYSPVEGDDYLYKERRVDDSEDRNRPIPDE